MVYRARPALNGVVATALIALAVLAISLMFGLIAASANPMLIGVGAGVIVIPILLIRPALAIWAILIIGLLAGELTGNPKLSKATWIISLLSMLLLIPAVVNIFWEKNRRLPFFLAAALAFLIYCIVSSAINFYSIEQLTAGFKRYFQAFGVMLALTMLAYPPETFVRWRKFLLVCALLQFPFALYQLLVLVPLRGGLASGSATTDVIAGTFGANIEGGSPSSVMVVFIFMALAFLVARWRVGLIRTPIFFLFALICFLPLGMGESKIAVIMLPMVAIILLKDELFRAPLRFILALIVIALLTAAIGYLYVAVLMKSTLGEVVDSTLRYNIGNQGYSAGQLLNRFTSITFWVEQQHWANPVSILFGNGLGSSYSTTGALGGHIAQKFIGYGINLTAASTLLWDTGVISLALFAGIFVAAWNAASRLQRQVLDASVQADTIAIKACISLFVLSIFYSDSIVNLVAMELLYAIVLGYLGFLMNQHGMFGNRGDKRPGWAV